MGRLSPELCGRTESFADRMLDVVSVLEKKKVYARILDQIVGCGTSVGANACESDQAMSAADFCKGLGIVVKELNESRYWLRLCARRGWVPESRTLALQYESDELSRIFSAMIVRTRRKVRRP